MKTTLLRLTNCRGTTELFQVTKKRKNSKRFETVTPVSFKEDIQVLGFSSDYRSSGTNRSFLMKTSRRLYDFHLEANKMDTESLHREWSFYLEYGEYEEVEINTSELNFTCDLDLAMDYGKEFKEIFEEFQKEFDSKEYHSWSDLEETSSKLWNTIQERHYRKFVNPEVVEVRGWGTEGGIFVKKDGKDLAKVDITTAFWSDLEVLGKLLSKHSVEEVADLINKMEYHCALNPNMD